MADKIRRIYVQLDALLDTRLGALWELNPALCDELMATGYHGRLLDNFQLLVPTINHELWKERYDNRNVLTLTQSRLTGIVVILANMIQELESEIITSPLIDGMEIVINTHPYELNQVELMELKDCIQTYTGNLAGVVTIYQPNVELTFATIKRDFDIVIMYDFHEWVSNVKQDDIVANPCPQVKLMVPALFEKQIPTERDLRGYENNTDGPFAELELNFQQYVTLHFWDAGIFSVILPAAKPPVQE